MRPFSRPAPAKLNLFLHITGRRDDGYHTLQTLFCRLEFGDTLDFFPNTKLGQETQTPLVFLDCPNLTLDIKDNLIAKAAHHLYNHACQHEIGTLCPVSIQLKKQIPTGAGLGGGSSNAATTLLALNDIWQLHLSTTTLLTLAEHLGADVPFFILNRPYAIAEGIGERLYPLDLPKTRFLLLFPDSRNSTESYFAHSQLKKDSEILSLDTIKTQHSDYLHALRAPFFNAFEAIALKNPAIHSAYNYLKALPSAATPRLTGTGSTVFVPLADSLDATLVATWCECAPCPAVISHSA